VSSCLSLICPFLDAAATAKDAARFVRDEIAQKLPVALNFPFNQNSELLNQPGAYGSFGCVFHSLYVALQYLVLPQDGNVFFTSWLLESSAMQTVWDVLVEGTLLSNLYDHEVHDVLLAGAVERYTRVDEVQLRYGVLCFILLSNGSSHLLGLMDVCMYACMYAHIYMYIQLYTCMTVCMYVCKCVMYVSNLIQGNTM
jgi:hypothetical protein